jgi:hypothetical protein
MKNINKCPYCSEEIQEEAFKCKHCGENVKYLSWWNVHKLINTKQYGGWSRVIDSLLLLLCFFLPIVGIPIVLIAMRSNHVVKNLQGKRNLYVGLMGVFCYFVLIITIV